MISNQTVSPSGQGTVLSPRFYDGPSHAQDDVSVRVRCFTYQTDEGVVAGRNTNHMFSIDRPAKKVWPYIKDFNLWHNAYGYYYSGVVGDLEGQDFYITPKNTPSENSANEKLLGGSLQQVRYTVLKVVPEHLIVIRQPAPQDGSTGGVSPGFHVIMLNDHGERTVVTMYTEHSIRFSDKSESEALAHMKAGEPETFRRFRDCFIPELKRVIYAGK